MIASKKAVFSTSFTIFLGLWLCRFLAIEKKKMKSTLLCHAWVFYSMYFILDLDTNIMVKESSRQELIDI